VARVHAQRAAIAVGAGAGPRQAPERGLRARRQDCRRATDALGAQLIRHRRGAWRHRWTAIGTAWSVCLIGWTGSVLLPVGAVVPATPAGAPGAAVASAAAAGERPSPAASRTRPLPDSRAAGAGLQADLEAALALRAARARQLAGMPRLLDGRRNPIHQRHAIQLDQQDVLIAALRRRLAALTAHAPRPDRRLPDPIAQSAGLPASPGGSGGTGQPAAGRQPTAASAPSGPSQTAAGAPRQAALCSVLLLAAAAGVALAAWRGRRDGIIDHPSQLRHGLRLPVLCTIDLPASPGAAQRERASRGRAALAGLGLLGLCASLVAADRAGALAAMGQGLLAGWPG
jgi:hypothetical protein